MRDIGLFINADNRIDLNAAGNDLVTDEGLQTAVIVSLFSDIRVTLDEKPDWEASQRGWWGDLFSEVPGHEIGSRLWLLKREKRVPETLRRAEDYAKEALAWMITDGIVDSIDVVASYDANGAMILGGSLKRPADSVKFKFKTAWTVEANRGH